MSLYASHYDSFDFVVVVSLLVTIMIIRNCMGAGNYHGEECLHTLQRCHGLHSSLRSLGLGARAGARAGASPSPALAAGLFV